MQPLGQGPIKRMRIHERIFRDIDKLFTNLQVIDINDYKYQPLYKSMAINIYDYK